MFCIAICFLYCKGLHHFVVFMVLLLTLFCFSHRDLVSLLIIVVTKPGRDVMSIHAGQRCHIRDPHF